MRHIFRRVIILLLVFFTVAGGVLLFTLLRAKEPVSYAKMEEAGLPVIEMTYSGQTMNELHGYTSEMTLPLVRDSITPLDGQRVLTGYVRTYGAVITEISYEVRSLDGQELIEAQTLGGWNAEEDNIGLTVQLSGLLKPQEEYCLILKLSTEAEQNIFYYTRVIYGPEMKTQELLDFAFRFSRATFEPETARQLVPQYLQPDSSVTDSDYSKVNIHSKYAAIIWNGLNPQLSGDRAVRVTELTPTQMSVVFSYQVLIADEAGEAHTFQVREYFCVRWRGEQLYLLDYEREMDQVFEPVRAEVNKGEMRLGILSGGRDSAQASASPDGNLMAFAAGGELFGYDRKTGEMWPVFTFRNVGENDARTNFREHDIKLVGCRDNGQIDFIVFGYMNRGIHEGEVGISFFRYDRNSGRTDELFYIPSNVSYQVLRSDLGSLAYVSSGNSFYLIYGRSIYSLDISSGETVQIAENVMQDSYGISSDNALIAWQEGDQVEDAGKIHCLNMDSGQIHEVTAAEGEYLKLEGFVGRDLVYGIGRTEDVQRSAGVVMGYPLYMLAIRNEEMEIQAEYSMDGIYISDVAVEENRIVMSRLRRGESGEMTEYTGDVLARSTEAGNSSAGFVKTARDDRFGTVYSIELQPKGQAGVQYRLSEGEYRSGELCQIVSLGGHETEAPQYYVYTRGRLKTVSASLSGAIHEAFDEMGTVLDKNQEYVWNRDSRALYKTLKLPAKETVSAEDSLAACIELMLACEGQDGAQVREKLSEGDSPFQVLSSLEGYKTVDLYGSALSHILYYINLGSPVLAVTGDHTGLLVIGYETNSVTYYDPVSGQNVKLPMKEAEALFSRYNNAFLSYLR
ncbi:hypothetical protein [Cuneatibacter caecimuris]|uniref:Peptidase C39-like protein n=1 Tax=Cuneatibacter caecimuris TaxID=1796618 RepID=A0A4Q7P3N8_9FIRM|nr:hypothetical protein [Cuneatibacter caecimuris]RZS94444.1 hypothetical protein EV209_2286 [Cuneatibacter caecimuris]